MTLPSPKTCKVAVWATGGVGKYAIRTIADRPNLELTGVWGSWFRYAGNGKFDWQRDFFDFGHIAARYKKLIKAGKLSDAMLKRLEHAMSGEKPRCWYPIGQTPVPLW